MGYKQDRRIVRFGAASSGIVLPKGWLEFYQLQHGDRVTVLGDSVLIVSTRADEAKARRLLELVEKGPTAHHTEG
jgi:antitoxin component of MazEF toxin-antitoxin module